MVQKKESYTADKKSLSEQMSKDSIVCPVGDVSLEQVRLCGLNSGEFSQYILILEAWLTLVCIMACIAPQRPRLHGGMSAF